ncbi:voltage-gated hydrogen channel 1 isoform X1 [Hydra vulgaris]|uniref:Voltage-gated hydrogen channel 1 n=1 Tax=Hydra vulgaris TaxID=6087 RepID=T2M809_HYDVU|nr:voltage-gated hydrogen channel 1 isoform X2 [Hydra vulgaris]
MKDDSKVNLSDAEVLEYSDFIIEEKPLNNKSDVNKTACIRKKLGFVIHHHNFQIIICLLVLLDIAIVVTEIMLESVNNNDNHKVEKAEKILHYVSLSILTLFMLELVIKIFAMGIEFFKQKFEIFDGLVITISFFLDIFLSSGGLKFGVEFLIILRLWRITRVISGIISSIKKTAAEKERKLAAEKEAIETENKMLLQQINTQKDEIRFLKELLNKSGIDENIIKPKDEA